MHGSEEDVLVVTAAFVAGYMLSTGNALTGPVRLDGSSYLYRSVNFPKVPCTSGFEGMEVPLADKFLRVPVFPERQLVSI